MTDRDTRIRLSPPVRVSTLRSATFRMASDHTTSEASQARSVAPTAPPALLGQLARYAPAFVIPACVELAWLSIFTHAISPAEFGRYALALSVAGLTSSILSQWMCQSVQRFLPGAPADTARRTLTLVSLYAAGIMVLAVVISAICAIAIPNVPLTLLITATVALIALLTVYALLAAVLQSRFRASAYSLFKSAGSVLRLIFGLGVLYLRDPTAIALLWVTALASGGILPALWRAAGVPTPRAAWEERKSLGALLVSYAAYGWPMAGWFIGATVLEVGDRFIIGIFRDGREVGVYAAVYGLLAGATALLSGPVILSVHTLLMKTWSDGQHGRAAEWTGLIIEWFLLAGTVIVSAAGLFAGDIASLVLGPAFREGASIIPAVVCGTTLWQVGLYTHKPLEFAGRTDLMLAACVGMALMNIILNCAFVPVYGYAAAAYVTLASNAGYVLMTWRLSQRYMRIPVRVRRIAALAAMCAVIVIATVAERQSGGRPLAGQAGVALTVAAFAAVALLSYIVVGRRLVCDVTRLERVALV